MKVLAVMLVSFIFLCLAAAQDAVLVLTNAQTIEISGNYEIKGNFVVFTDADGELNQLPKKLVDFEATERMNAAKTTEDVAEVVDPPAGERSIASVSERLDLYQRSEPINLSDNDLNRYARSHPGNRSDQQDNRSDQKEVSSQEPWRFDPSPESEDPADPVTTDLKSLQRALSQQLAVIDARIRQLDADIKKREKEVITNSLPPREKYWEDDLGGGFHENELDDQGKEIPNSNVGAIAVRNDYEIAQMKREREELLRERAAIIAKGRKAGVRNLR